MEKLRFDFKIRGTARDGKTNILCLISIGTPDGRSFTIPDEHQPINLHKELTETQTFEKIKKTLSKKTPVKKSLDNVIQRIK